MRDLRNQLVCVVCCALAACTADTDPTTVTSSPASDPGASGDPGTTAPDDPTTGADASASGSAGATSGSAGATTSGGDDPTPADPGESAGESAGESEGGAMCLPATAACADPGQCCAGLECGQTTLGQVCCGLEGAPCTTPNGEDCCGDLLCVGGACGYSAPDECGPPCTEAPALVIEKKRLVDIIGGTFLGICGDANHTYGYHVPAAELPADDYSLAGAANTPVCEWHAAAIDIGMVDWPASRDWLKWLIPRIASDDIQGIAEVIGSYDGVDVRYWSDGTGWSVEGVPYQGTGHDTHTHVAIYRSTALVDHGILAGWTANGGP